MQTFETPKPLAVRPNRAAELLGLSRAAFWRLLQRGEIRSVKVGSARLIPLDALYDWLAKQAS